jgi:DNA (cytosine-5)-methyltransferase 1
MAQHNSSTPIEARDSWRTPPWLFRWLDERFHFDVDLAADDSNFLCASYYTRADDALSQPWSEEALRGFLNCPYSDIDPWVEKAIEEQRKGFLTALLMPSFNGEERFRVVFEHASEIIDIVGRVAFLKPDGAEVKGNTRGSAVYIFDPARLFAPCQRWWVLRDSLIKQYTEAEVSA